MALKKTNTPSEKSATATTSSTLSSSESRRNFFIVHRNGLRVDSLTFDESWDMFCEALESDNPCSVFRENDELRIDP